MGKRTLFLIASLLLSLAGVQTAFAQKMVVKTADGKVVKYNVTKVTEVSFEEAEPVEWIDLGLPSGTLWASCNIGANNPEDYGYYFAWGETETKENYTWSTYFDYDADDSSNRHKKYNKDSGLKELLPEDDAASAILDVECKMPSKKQFEELLNSKYTGTVWTQRDGVNGYKITSIKNGNSIFLPAAGFYNSTYPNSQGSNGYYWSRTLSETSNSSAGAIYFSSSSISTLDTGRMMGFSVRPVQAPPTSGTTDGHDWVDLGLPSGTLWATMNVGSNAPEGQGDTFRWGETEPYDGSGAETYKFYGNWHWSEDAFQYVGDLTKYCSSCGYEGFADGLTELEPEDDAATVIWGSEWQMPSKAQCDELGNSANTTISFTTQSGIKGVLITSKMNDNSIFLPTQKDYWTREKDNGSHTDTQTDLYRYATFLFLNWNGQKYFTYSSYRTDYYSIRPVRKQ
ncbi:MAG: hypothetical protein IKQ37_05040 [Bacteroidaceae bacterium]|nr:hypothetical protein [Bacteroidaceae bacterium]